MYRSGIFYVFGSTATFDFEIKYTIYYNIILYYTTILLLISTVTTAILIIRNDASESRNAQIDNHWYKCIILQIFL